jgi:hypothetical protein
MPCSTPMSCLLVGLDYVKDRWAFQKEDGSEHKEHTSMRSSKRYCREIFSCHGRANLWPENCFYLFVGHLKGEQQLQVISLLPNYQKNV